MKSEQHIKLQPMTVVEIVSWSLRFYRENFRKLIVLVVPGFAGWLIIFLFVFRYDAIGSPTGTHELYVALSLFVFLFLSAVVAAEGTIAISGQLVAKEMSAGKACMRVLDVGFPLLGTLTLSTIVITIGLRLFLIPGIIAYVWFCLAPPVVMIEGEGGLGALKRSRAIVKDYFSKTFLIVVPVAIIEILLAWIILFLPNLFGNLSYLNHLLLSTVFTILLLLAAPLKIAATTMLYYDLRVRKEGYDLQSLAEEFAELPF
jgi:hypothetical protein